MLRLNSKGVFINTVFMAPITKKMSGKTCCSRPWGSAGGNWSMTRSSRDTCSPLMLATPRRRKWRRTDRSRVLVVHVTSNVDVLLAVFVQILVQVPPLRRRQAAVLDVVERLAAVGLVEPLEVKQRHVLAAKQTAQKGVLPTGAGHVENGSG